MAANEVGACNDPLLETSKCRYCRSSNGLECSICPKVFHTEYASCSMKLKKCCDVGITEILITDEVSEETTIMEPKSTDITSVNNNTDLKKNEIKGAIKKIWMCVGRVSGRVSEMIFWHIWTIFRTFKQSI
ncbi:hypothetical protein WA026_023280 [Henosepilachna vigintioctopunctata]|uniref:Uncharacterized protein n=1 Tax=Henosepilachna vigintioctopunctata TaxID=420089 RepID=A0AAW1UC24_9CUCU